MDVTIFKNIYDKDNPYFVDVSDVLQRIKTGYKIKQRILNLRSENKETQTQMKKTLMSICFSGKFTARYDDQLIEHSGLAVLDFDKIENPEGFKEQLSQDKIVFAAFISPSGKGVKALVKIPPEPENHSAYYLGLIKKYPELDTTNSNVSRVCFVSYDPDIYINKNSEVFKQKGTITKTEIPVPYYTHSSCTKSIETALNMIRRAEDGEKHHQLIKASYLVGGMIAGGLVEEFESITALENEINRKDIDDFKGAQKTIRDGIKHGKSQPIHKDNFDESYNNVITKTEIILEGEPVKDVIYLDDIEDKMWKSFKEGTSKGTTTYFPHIDPHYTWRRQDLTLWHGFGNHGKTQMCIQLCLIKSVKEGTKWGVFSPESQPTEEFYKDIIHTYIGKSTESYHYNQMSEEEYKMAMDFVKDHFFYIYPKDDSPTPEYMRQRFRELIIKHGIDGAIIDPYNQLDNDIRSIREDQYISRFLTRQLRFAQEHNIYHIIITHPNTRAVEKDKWGNFIMPSVFTLSGGMMWNNKVDNILCLHRPYFYTDYTNPTVIFSSQRIKKQKLVGRPGDVELIFNIKTNRYYQSNGFNPLEKMIKEEPDDFPEKTDEEIPF